MALDEMIPISFLKERPRVFSPDVQCHLRRFSCPFSIVELLSEVVGGGGVS